MGGESSVTLELEAVFIGRALIYVCASNNIDYTTDSKFAAYMQIRTHTPKVVRVLDSRRALLTELAAAGHTLEAI